MHLFLFPQSLSSILSLIQHLDKVKLPQSKTSNTDTIHTKCTTTKILNKPIDNNSSSSNNNDNNNNRLVQTDKPQREVLSFVFEAITDFMDLDKVRSKGEVAGLPFIIFWIMLSNSQKEDILTLTLFVTTLEYTRSSYMSELLCLCVCLFSGYYTGVFLPGT